MKQLRVAAGAELDDTPELRSWARTPPRDEPSVVFGRVDADARLVDDADGDRVAGLEHAELLELLGGLERGGGKRAELQQEVAAIGVEAEVQVGDRGRGRARAREGRRDDTGSGSARSRAPARAGCRPP